MANSIAGNVHGAKPAAPTPQTQRYYPQLDGIEGIHPEVSKAIRYLYDNVYELQRDQQAAAGAAKTPAAAAGDKSATPDPSYATGLHGILVRAPTDPSSLKQNYTIRYNAKTGEFDFGI